MAGDNLSKLYFSISEVAGMLKVSNSLIRFWESEFSSIRPRKNSKGDRLFMQKDIDELKMIYHLVKVRGFTLNGAKRELKLNKDRIAKKHKALESLKKMKEYLVDLKEQLAEDKS